MNSAARPTKDQVMRALVVNEAMQRCVDMITDSLAYSFKLAPCRMTGNEVRDRFERAYKIWKELRAEHRYPLSRIEGCLPQYLVMDIEGAEWDPLKRRTWLPGDGISHTHEALPTYEEAFDADPQGFLRIFEELKSRGYLK